MTSRDDTSIARCRIWAVETEGSNGVNVVAKSSKA